MTNGVTLILKLDRPMTAEAVKWVVKSEKMLSTFVDSPEFQAVMEKGIRDMMTFGTSIVKSSEIDGALKAFHVPYLETLKDEQADA